MDATSRRMDIDNAIREAEEQDDTGQTLTSVKSGRSPKAASSARAKKQRAGKAEDSRRECPGIALVIFSPVLFHPNFHDVRSKPAWWIGGPNGGWPRCSEHDRARRQHEGEGEDAAQATTPAGDGGHRHHR